MCGISGYWGDFNQDLLVKMNQVQSHRGPDDSGIYTDPVNSLGLSHQRLAIIDLSPEGKGPMWDATGKAVITYNGELYNYRELKQELLDDGFEFKTQTDTEVLINLYLKEGKDFLKRLNGMFAFALWDTRSKELLLARDGFGVKPLYFSKTPLGFLFASEVKTLMAEKSISRDLNYQALSYYMTYLWSPAPDTALKQVELLAPGQAMILRDQQIVKKWYFYDLPYANSINTQITEEEAISETRRLIEQSVKRQLISDVEVGTFLSGGLDSSALSYFAAKNTNKKLQAFTIAFSDGSAKNEGMTEDLPYAKKVADSLGIDLHQITVGPEMAHQLEAMIYHLDAPQGDPAALNQMFICSLAKQKGIKVLLSGAGGDDVFTGYRRHYALLQEKYWGQLPQFIRQSLKFSTSLLGQKGGLRRRVAKAFSYADCSEQERLISYFYWTHPDLVNSLWNKSLRGNLSSVQEPFLKSLARIPEETLPLNKLLYLEGKHFLADHNLLYGDKMSMAESVEVRVPFLDPDLVQFATTLPLKFKQNGRIGKYIFKKAMESYLPREVIYRPKTGFGVPLRHWLNHQLKELKRDILARDTLLKRGLFDPLAVQSLLKKDELGLVDGTYTLFSLMCIELWCQKFID